VKSADQVALEAGNSAAIIFKHYRELATEEQAEEWFGILPKPGQWENAVDYDTRTRTVNLAAGNGRKEREEGSEQNNPELIVRVLHVKLQT